MPAAGLRSFPTGRAAGGAGGAGTGGQPDIRHGRNAARRGERRVEKHIPPMPPAVAERQGPTTPSTVRRDYPSSLVAHNGFEPGVEFHSAIRAHRGRALRSAPADLSAVGSTVVRFAIPSRRRRNPTHGLTLVSREPRSRSGSLKDILSVAEQGFFGIAGSAGVAMNSTGTR